MATKTERIGAGGFIVSEANGDRSRAEVTVASSATYGDVKAGSVLGKITASGKYGLYDNALSDGTEAAAAIAITDCDATGADAKVAVIVRDAVVNQSELSWYDKTNDETAGAADLLALEIICR